MYLVSNEIQKRFFLPLARDPYHWFKNSNKQWELRRSRGRFNLKQIYLERRVELRYGYGTSQPPLWGQIIEIKEFTSIKEVFQYINPQNIIPIAASANEAEKIAAKIIGIDPNSKVPLIAFRIKLDSGGNVSKMKNRNHD